MTGIVSIYLWFMVAQMEHLVHKLDGEMNLLSGIFCALRLYKKKIDMFFALIVFPYTIYKSAQENKNRNSNKEISEPLVKKD